MVLSNATPEVTFTRLMTEDQVPADFRRAVAGVDYTSAVCKINLAVDKLPNFVADPNSGDGSTVMPHHKTTIHLNCENTDMIVEAYKVSEEKLERFIVHQIYPRTRWRETSRENP